MACDSCRRKKVRCDGNEPCAKCLYAPSACHYRAPTGSPSAPSTGSRAEPAANASLDQTMSHSPVSNTVNPTSIEFAAYHTAHDETFLDGSLSFDSLLDTDLDAAQARDRGMHHPGYSGPGEMPAHVNWMCDIPGMASSSENIFSHFTNVGGIEDCWQIPPIVCCIIFNPSGS